MSAWSGQVKVDIQLISWNAFCYSQLRRLTGSNLLTFFLTYLLTFFMTYLLIYLLTFFLTYLLTFFLTYLPIFFLTYLLTFFLTYLPHMPNSFGNSTGRPNEDRRRTFHHELCHGCQTKLTCLHTKSWASSICCSAPHQMTQHELCCISYSQVISLVKHDPQALALWTVTHIFWHSVWHIFWHSFWHIF